MSIGMTKVAVIGCGTVGSMFECYLASNLVCNKLFIIINRNGRKAWAEAKSLQHSMRFVNGKAGISSDIHASCGDADMAVLAIGPM